MPNWALAHSTCTTTIASAKLTCTGMAQLTGIDVQTSTDNLVIDKKWWKLSSLVYDGCIHYSDT